MKAVRMYQPKDLRVEDVKKPEMQADEVMVKVQACGVCGSDIPRILTYGAHVSPIICGHEFSGEIEAVGSEVEGYQPGDRVVVPPLIPCGHCEWCQKGIYSLCEDYDYYGSRRDGAFAQYVSVKKTNLMKVPDGVSYEDAATLDPCANAWHGLINRGHFKEGDTVAVVGTGPIGLFAVQIAHMKGAKKIIAVDVWDKKLEIAKTVGADVVVNSLNDDPIEAVKAATDGEGANVVVDFSGSPIAQQQAIMMAAKMGRVVFLGISHKGLDLKAETVDTLMRGQIELAGSWNSFTAPFPGEDWTESLKMYTKGMTAKDIISHRITLDEVPDIFKKIDAGHYFFNKIMIFPWKEA
ncbi:MAG: galactitol-1-phosphate 5-dehydrogenase [Pseudoramibacter sp.]|nr:galactitol-1-phosphate 5-dehydrogenase [Pseudoramibacter sp.]MCH4071592.1 galactitol-1-phosphate 5-dehydrogenase [Pseudoramibacter sp.]MCH4105360.1 galactitol-1-phosphate 5-dehydrogenase [Pseudoramibacter sp.]